MCKFAVAAAACLVASFADVGHTDIIWLRMRVVAGDSRSRVGVLLFADAAGEGGDGDYFCH